MKSHSNESGFLIIVVTKGKTMKSKKNKVTCECKAETDIGRGEIKDNFLAALVTSKVYKTQIVKAKKGRGSFKRKGKHQAKYNGQEPYLIAA